MSSRKLHEIIQSNLNTLMKQDINSSMRNLSTSIGASDSYIQKIMSGNSLPSLDKLEIISEHYDIDVWTLLYDYGDEHQQILPIIQQIHKLPPDELPVITAYLNFLIEQNKKGKS